jgi:hypothetical protein
MIAALLAASAAIVSTPMSPVGMDDVPALAALGPQPEGATAVKVTLGRPFHSVRVEHGFWGFFDVGGGADLSPDGYYRGAGEVRLRALRAGPVQLVARILAARVFSSKQGVADTNDAEAGLQLAVAPLPYLGVFTEGSLVGTTDFTRQRTAGFWQVLGGAALALPGGVSILGSIGVLEGARGGRIVGSSGASVRF